MRLVVSSFESRNICHRVAILHSEILEILRRRRQHHVFVAGPLFFHSFDILASPVASLANPKISSGSKWNITSSN